ncbi:hypothetical protein OFO10_05565 [Campylobacter sp. VBCF_06 NA8]|nr:hypothetical protein [Campylobacter sp. VBCF_06 NA8]MDA3046622.1 hypothetical protein [Campylobacter sp. VBCF_06 NA8]
MIKIENLHKSFGNNEIIKGVSADIKKGEILAIVGKSGAFSILDIAPALISPKTPSELRKEIL